MRNTFLILGQVTGIHLADDCLVQDRLDASRYQPLARMGYRDYAIITETFEHLRLSES